MHYDQLQQRGALTAWGQRFQVGETLVCDAVRRLLVLKVLRVSACCTYDLPRIQLHSYT